MFDKKFQKNKTWKPKGANKEQEQNVKINHKLKTVYTDDKQEYFLWLGNLIWNSAR